MTNNIYGYLRVSTESQTIDTNKGEILLKINNLGLKGNIKWIEETISGTKHWKNRELGKLINIINKNDVIITSELSRIGRSLYQCFEFISVCAEKEVQLYFTKTDFKIDSSISSQTLIFAYSLTSQIERELISLRTKSALQNAKSKGIILGRPRGKMKLDKDINEIRNLINQGVKYKAIAKKYKVTETTMSKFIKKNNLKVIETQEQT